jgi:hypothetical protein
MPAFKLDSLPEYTLPLTITWSKGLGETQLSYRPYAYSGADRAAFKVFEVLTRAANAARVAANAARVAGNVEEAAGKAQEADAKDGEALREWIQRSVSEWDIEFNRKVVPITKAGLAGVADVVLISIRDAIFADEVLNPLREPASKSG